MSNRHMRLHRRQGNVWNDFTEGIASIANDFNPFHHEPTPGIQAKQNGPSTVFKTVYTTMSATFTGAVGGYSTVDSGGDDTKTTKAEPTHAKVTTTSASGTKPTGAPVGAASAKESSDLLPESLVPTSSDGQSTLALATDSPTTTLVKAPSTAATGTGTKVDAGISASSTAAASSSSSDTSGAAKAGIAIGVLAGILVVGLLVYFMFSKRRKQLEKQRAEDDEKINGSFGGAAAVTRRSSVQTNHTSRTNPNAPRLSLRPVTEFMPNFGERRSSKGAAIALSLTGPGETHTQIKRPAGSSPWERQMTSPTENPFDDNAERPGTSNGYGPVNPFNAPENVVGMATTTNTPTGSSPMAGAAGAAAGAAAGVGLTRKQSIQRKEVPKALDLTTANLEPIPAPSASPAATEFSFTSVAPGQSPGPSNSANAIAAAGGPPATTVHRVQLDFKPTLEDEMELRAGQLVRLLHEYDDGWALCIRLDRSQQGVVPRTCLSTRPVKPRAAGGPPGSRNGPPIAINGPRGPPRGPGPNSPLEQRPMTPQAGPTHPRPESPMRPMTAPGRPPQSPGGMRGPEPPTGIPRPQSPAGMRRAQSPGPRPMGPYNGPSASGGPRGQSPGPRQRGYSNASANGSRPGPPGPSPMNPAGGPNHYRGPPQGPVGRKPVPGQAY